MIRLSHSVNDVRVGLTATKQNKICVAVAAEKPFKGNVAHALLTVYPLLSHSRPLPNEYDNAIIV
jgi:hypothetical protein